MSLLLFLACGSPLNAVSVRPISGWVDGCSTVTISGSGFGNDVVASIGGARVDDVLPSTDAADVGYEFTARVPAASQPGYADVTVSSGGAEDTITGSGAYYYVACPSTGHVDGIGATSAVAGDVVTVSGCSLDAASMLVRLRSADGATLSPRVTPDTVCGTASFRFSVPSVPPGVYGVLLYDLSGNILAGDECEETDSGDTGSSSACLEFPLTVESAR